MDWAYYLVYVVGGVWIFSVWAVRRSLGLLSIQRHLPDRAFCGQRLTAKAVISNRSWLPVPWLVLQERSPLELRDETDYRIALSVGGRSSIEHEYSFDCKQRGYYSVGPLSLTSGDLFGFAQNEWRENATPHLLVYPRIVPIHELGLPSRIPFGRLSTQRPTVEDPARLAGVRAYTANDDLRRVHWKATAHSGEMLVKKFQPAIALEIQIILDLNRRIYPIRELVGASEWGVTIAASVASYAIQERQAAGLLCNGIDGRTLQRPPLLLPRNGQNQLTAILSQLACVQLTPIGDAAQDAAQNAAGGAPRESSQASTDLNWLIPALGEIGWGTTVIVVTPAVSEDLLWLLYQARRRGAEALALVCAQQPDFLAMQARAQRLGIRLQQTLWQKDLQMLTEVGGSYARSKTRLPQ